MSKNPGVLKRMASHGNLKSAIAALLRFFYPAVSGFDYGRMRSNVTLTISEWTRDIIRQAYGIDARVVYPPVVFTGELKPWMERKNGFICVGRIEPDKNIEQVIEIIEKVRNRGYDMELCIAGAPSPSHPKYPDRLLRKYLKGGDWISIEANLSRKDLENKIAGFRYGIHARKNEHFGISVAELVKGGCIPFIPMNGGQMEILDHKDELLFENPDDAVGKIIHILSDEGLRRNIRKELDVQAGKFSKIKFENEILDVVNNFRLEGG